MNRQKLSHGFLYGVNHMTITKILEWQHSENINWRAFLWYTADFIKILDFGENWFEVNIVSDNQSNFFYNKVIEYKSNICEHNYFTDIQNDLWRDHKKGAKNNLETLYKLLK